MAEKSDLEQHIAVFGESGSGKTVLLSSFYGAAQEPEFLSTHPYRVLAEDQGQGYRLHSNYLGMRDEAKTPRTNRFIGTSYAFNIKMKPGEARGGKARPAQSLKLVWHDYPGEWFEQAAADGQETENRTAMFRGLLKSDVGLVLVDAARLIETKGEEERYLKLLLGNLRNSLLSAKDEILEDGQRLTQFPRIWVIALSKADLLPELDVYGFRDLVIAKAAAEVAELRQAIAEFVQADSALSVGEDFLLLSSAKFEPGQIQVTERIGVNVVLPLGAMLPFERRARWSELKMLPVAALRVPPPSADQIRGVLLAARAMAMGKADKLIARVNPDMAARVAAMAVGVLGGVVEEATRKQEYLRATFAAFRIALRESEDEKVFLRSQR